MPRQQRRHDIFRNGVFVPEGVADGAPLGQRIHIDLIVTGGGQLEQPCGLHSCALVMHANDHVRPRQRLGLARPVSRIRDDGNLVRHVQLFGQTRLEGGGIGAVEDDVHHEITAPKSCRHRHR